MASDSWGQNRKEYERIAANGPPQTSVENIVKAIDRQLPLKNAKGILDSGCGTGYATTYLIEHYGDQIPDSATLSALDLSSGMIAKVESLKAENSNNKLWDRLQTAVCSVESMPHIKDESLSHIVASMVMFFPKTPHKGFSEAYRVLEPQGIFGFSSPKNSEWMDLFEIPEKAMPGLHLKYTPTPDWQTADAIEANLIKAGFKDVQTFEVETSLEINDAVKFMSFFMGNANDEAKEFFKSNPGKKEEAIQLIVDYLHDKYQDKTPKLYGTLFITTARK